MGVIVRLCLWLLRCVFMFFSGLPGFCFFLFLFVLTLNSFPLLKAGPDSKDLTLNSSDLQTDLELLLTFTRLSL